jgi:hypothetical protein
MNTKHHPTDATSKKSSSSAYVLHQTCQITGAERVAPVFPEGVELGFRRSSSPKSNSAQRHCIHARSLRGCAMQRFPVLRALCLGTVASTLAFPLASFAQTETCKFALLPSLEGGTGNGINHSDTIVGTYFPTGQAGFRGFIRESDGRIKTYQVPGSQSTYLTGINDKGAIVGGFDYQSAAQAYGFKLNGRKRTPINYPGASITDPRGINNKGEIVGTEEVDATSPGKGFLLSKGQFTDIQFPGAAATGANGINNMRVIVGTYFDQTGATHGFVLVKDQYFSLDFPGASFTTATGINDEGEIVGQYSMMNGALQSFVYEDGQFETVNIPATYRSSVNAVNARGDLTGDTFTHRQTQPAFFATHCK